MPPFLALTFGILSRLLPSLLGHVGRNLTAVGASLLFFGARRPTREIPLAALALALTDILLTTIAFHLPFHPAPYLLTWLWYLATPLLGRDLLRPRTPAPPLPAAPPRTPHTPPPPSIPARATLAVLLASGSFFVLSNGSVWLLSPLYSHTPAGLLACLAAGLPFLRNDLLSTGLCLALFLALPSPSALRARLPPAPTPPAVENSR